MYRKEFHRITPHDVANFLIFDKSFPRSIYHCIAKAKISLHRITGSPEGAVTNRAEKNIGRLMADLEYTDIEEVIESGLHEFLDNLQTRLNLLGVVIGTTFFNVTPQAPAQTGEQLAGGSAA